MKIDKQKPTSAGKRHARRLSFQVQSFLPEDKLERIRASLSKKLTYSAGRNNHGKRTMRTKGGQAKRKYIEIDFSRDKRNIAATVVAIEYDPNRTAHIALLKYEDGEYRYILAPDKLELGDKVIASEELQEITAGNAYPLEQIPPATFIHNIELTPGKGAVLGRSAGVSIQLQGKAGKGYVQVKLPSGEIRLVKGECYATIGTVGNLEHSNQKLGKAGVNRNKGKKPTVRGVAQSYKHPHAGGQGKSGRTGTGGPSKDPWGNKRGVITRRRKNTNKYIIKRRTSKLRPRNKKYKTLV
ncbi:MAG: 50S ribosomal protein L2 [Candidatus Dojkabacteria bacterium]